MSIFDEPIERRGTDSCKWGGEPNELPMWVADMDFKAPAPVIEALKKRIDHGVYGYAMPSKEWAEAYRNFYHDLYQWDIEPKNLHFVFSVVAAVYAAVGAYSKPGDEVALLTPAYHHFLSPIRHSGRKVLEVPLLYNGKDYAINWQALQDAFARPSVSLFIFCNPHNPMGMLFSKEEITRLIGLAKTYGVTIFSDEIHGPICEPNNQYVPFLTLPGAKDVGITAISPSKAFNLAGLHTAALVIDNEALEKPMMDWLDRSVYEDPNVLSCVAAIAAYNEGREWLKEMNAYVHANRMVAEEFIAKEIPSLHAIHGEATYLMWVDCQKVCGHDSAAFSAHLRKETGLVVSSGETFGSGGEGFIRLNLATTRANVEEGMRRLKKGAETFPK